MFLAVSGISNSRCVCKVNKGQTFILVPALQQNTASISSNNWFQPELSLSPARKKALYQSITYLHSYSSTAFRCTDGHQKGDSGRARLAAGIPFKGNHNCVISKLIRRYFTCFFVGQSDSFWERKAFHKLQTDETKGIQRMIYDSAVYEVHVYI